MSSLGYGSLGASSSFDEEDPHFYHTNKIKSTETKPTSTWKNIAAGAAIVAFSISGVLLFASKSSTSVTSSSGAKLAKETSSSSITTTVTNEYTSLNQSHFAYSFLESAVLMEPWRDSTVTISGISSECTNSWKLVGKDSLSDEVFSGDIDSDNSFVAVPQKTGFYKLHIYSKCGSETHKYDQDVAVKYVRRELFTLTETDREEFLDALRTLWDVSTEEGIVKYGPNYKSLYYFATIHNDGGANPICDEFHRNSGFLTNHVFLGAFLEQSLQLVNPRTALHYWEYAQSFSSSDFQKHVDNQLDGGSWTELMTAKYVGASDPKTGVILDGRWAYTEVPRVTSEFMAEHGIPEHETFFPNEQSEWMLYATPHISNPYGLMRGPWNYSPSKYTLRFNNAMMMPSGSVMDPVTFKAFSGSVCSDYKMFIKNNVIGHPLSNYLLLADAQVHGYTHYTVGGAGGDYAITVDARLRSEFGFEDNDIAVLAIATARFMKTWLSHGKMPLPDDKVNPFECDASPFDPATGLLTTEAAPGDGGPMCRLVSYYTETEERMDSLMEKFFIDFQSQTYLRARDDLYLSKTFAEKQTLLPLIFSRMQIDGDMAGSGSAHDPLFWLAHGAVERLYQRSVFEEALTDKVYAVNEGGGSWCQGHAPEYSPYWLKGFYFEDKTVVAHSVSNAELAAILDPTGDQYATYIPFIYDSSRFDFCDNFEQWWANEQDDDVWITAPAEDSTAPAEDAPAEEETVKESKKSKTSTRRR